MNDLQAHLERANQLITLNRDAQAMELLLRLLREHPGQAGWIELIITRAHLKAQRLAEAEIHARRAIAQLPEEVGGYLMLGATLQLLGRRQEALETLLTAVRLDPDQPSAHRALAEVFSDLGRHRDAFEAASQALRLDPHHAESHFAMGYALQDTNPQEAIRAYRTALSIDPEHTTAKHNLAGISATRGDWTTASEGMARVLAEAPSAQSPIFVLDQRLVGVIRWLHWVTAGGYVLFGMGASVGAWPALGAAIVVPVVAGLLGYRGIRPIRATLPDGGGRFFAGFWKREPVAAIWLALLALAWVLMLIGSIGDVLLHNDMRWLGGSAVILVIIGVVLSWVRVPLANRKAERVRREIH